MSLSRRPRHRRSSVRDPRPRMTRPSRIIIHFWHPLQFTLREKVLYSPLYIVDMEKYRVAVSDVQFDLAELRTRRIRFGATHGHPHGQDCVLRMSRVPSPAPLALRCGHTRTARCTLQNIIHWVTCLNVLCSDWGQWRIIKMPELLLQSLQQRCATERTARCFWRPRCRS